MANKWWAWEPEEYRRTRDAQSFKSWADEEEDEDSTPPWQKSEDLDRSKVPPIGPRAAQWFERNSTRQLDEWKSALLGPGPETPGPAPRYQPPEPQAPKPTLELPDWAKGFIEGAQRLGGQAQRSFVAGLGRGAETMGAGMEWAVRQDEARRRREAAAAKETPIGRVLTGLGLPAESVSAPPFPEARQALVEGMIGGARGLAEAGRGIAEAHEVKEKPAWRGFESLLDPEYLSTTGAETLGTTLPLMAVGTIAAIATGGVAAGAGVGSVGSMLLGSAAGAALSRPLESLMEAGGAYKEAMADGKSEEEASDAASKVFVGNLGLAGTDAIQFAIMLGTGGKLRLPFSQAVKNIATAPVKELAKLATNIAVEGGEEVYQEALQQTAQGKEISPERLAEAGALGGLMGAGFHGGFRGAQALGEAVEKGELPHIGFTVQDISQLREQPRVEWTPQEQARVEDALEWLRSPPHLAPRLPLPLPARLGTPGTTGGLAGVLDRFETLKSLWETPEAVTPQRKVELAHAFSTIRTYLEQGPEIAYPLPIRGRKAKPQLRESNPEEIRAWLKGHYRRNAHIPGNARVLAELEAQDVAIEGTPLPEKEVVEQVPPRRMVAEEAAKYGGEMAPGTSVQTGLPGIGPAGAQATMLGEFGGAPGTAGEKIPLISPEELRQRAEAKPLPGQTEFPIEQGVRPPPSPSKLAQAMTDRIQEVQQAQEQARQEGKAPDILKAQQETELRATLAAAQVGNETSAYGADPKRQYKFRFRVVELDDLIPSQTDAMAPNPAYPKELQPRLRDRTASKLQVDQIAKTLVPDVLLNDVGQLDRGPMIVGTDMVVESGNGRVLALRTARQEYPDSWSRYVTELVGKAHEYGFDPENIASMKAPVLVRERTSPVNRMAFAREANEVVVLGMSPLEEAIQDAEQLTPHDLASMNIGEDESVDQFLRSSRGRPLARSFIGKLPANERASLMDAEGLLNQRGLQRLKGALFAKVFPGEAGQRLTEAFFESLDPSVKMVEHGLYGALPALARTEGLVRSGQRDAALSLGEDLSKAVDALDRLRTAGQSVADYVSQGALWERELTPNQEHLLGLLDGIARSSKKVRQFLGAYATGVEAAPHPEQETMFGGARLTKEALLGQAARAIGEEVDFRAAEPRAEAAAEEVTATGQAGPQLEGGLLAQETPSGLELPPAVRAVHAKLTAMKTHNSAIAGRALDALDAEGFFVDDARASLKDYREIDRNDFEDASDYKDTRDNAWDDFLDAVEGIESIEAEKIGATAPPKEPPIEPPKQPPPPEEPEAEPKKAEKEAPVPSEKEAAKKAEAEKLVKTLQAVLAAKPHANLETIIHDAAKEGQEVTAKDVERALDEGEIAQSGVETFSEPSAEPPGPTIPPVEEEAGAPGPQSDLDLILDGLENGRIKPSVTVMEQLTKAWIAFVKETGDRTYDLDVLEKRVQKAIGRALLSTEKATYYRAVMPGASTASEQIMKEELAPILRAVPPKLRDAFRAYLITMDQADKDAMMQNPDREWSWGTLPQNIQARLADLRQRVGNDAYDLIERQAQLFWEYQDRLLARKRDAGIVSQELYDFLVNNFPHYSRIRILDYMNSMDQGQGQFANVRTISVSSNGLRHLTKEGTTKGMDDPLQQAIALTYETISMVFRNRAANATVDMANLMPAGQAPVREVSADYTAKTGQGEAIFHAFRNGRKHRYVTTKEFADMISMRQTEFTGLVGFLAKLMREPLRIGATGLNILFLPVNLTGDALTYFVREGGSIGQYAKAIKHVFTEDEVYRAFIKGGGGMAGFYGQVKGFGTTRQKAGRVRELGQGSWYEINTLSDVGRLMKDLLTLKPVSYVGGRLELIPRVATYAGRVQKGAPEIEAVVAGRRVTMDFLRGGSFSMLMNQFVPYFNVAFQAPWQVARSFYEQSNPTAVGLRLAALTVPIILASIWNSQFEEEEEIPQYIKDRSLVLMLPWSGRLKDRFGKTIPEAVEFRVREFAPFMILTQEVMRRFRGENPRAWDKLVKGMLTAWSPIQMTAEQPEAGALGTFLPPPIATVAEFVANKDFYTGRPIIPEERLHLSPEEQAQAWTSDTARLIARAIGVPAAKVDHFIVSNLGGLGRQLIGGSDLLAKLVMARAGQEQKEPKPGEKVFAWWVPKEKGQEPSMLTEEEAQEFTGFVKDGMGALYIVAGKDEEAAKNKVFARDYLAVLGSEEPPSRMPVIGGLLGTIYKTQAGGVAQKKQEAAEEKIGPGVVRQTAKAWTMLRPKLDEIKTMQQALDKKLSTAKITGNQWREEYHRLQDRKRGLLEGVGIAFPVAALTGERASAYKEALATMGGTVPDKRTRVEILADAYLSMTPELDEDGYPDMPEFFERRKAFMEALPEEDKEAISAQISKNASPVQKRYFQAQELMGEYMELPRYQGMAKELGDEAATAARQLRALAQRVPPTARNRTAVAVRQLSVEQGRRAALLAKRAQRAKTSLARRRFRFEHGEELNRFYSDLLRAEQTPLEETAA